VLLKWPKIDEVEGKLAGAWQMRAGCDPETRKRISRLRLNRLSSALALGELPGVAEEARALVISFLSPALPSRHARFFPSDTFARKNRSDKSLLAVSSTCSMRDRQTEGGKLAGLCGGRAKRDDDDETVR